MDTGFCTVGYAKLACCLALSRRLARLELHVSRYMYGLAAAAAYGQALADTAEFSEGLFRLFRLPRLLRPEPGTPATAEGTMEDAMFMEEMELGGENMGCEDRGLTFTELKKGKLLAESGLLARPLVAQLL